MKISTAALPHLCAGKLQLPLTTVFALPEKVLQFGTGVLLRGLPDFFINAANNQEVFNGRIVVVKSTDTGDTNAFATQDGLYTHIIRGRHNGAIVEENIVNASISRVLSAKTEWQSILACAHNPEMQLIISNTTEVGLQLVKETIMDTVPVSFPGKLLAFLLERYKAFNGSAASGMIIIPTELITDNGTKLKRILEELALFNALDAAFIDWLLQQNTFCNSLVDRIVPGRPEKILYNELESTLGYSDELMIMSEPYALWAIEGDEKIKTALSFATVHEGVIICPDITQYKELKLRLLNGTHTLSCGAAFLHGFTSVKQAMQDSAFAAFISKIMLQDIANGIPYSLPAEAANNFGKQVLERFSNTYIEHKWINITMQYTAKMKMRVIPVLLEYYARHNNVPDYLAYGFAAYLKFMQAQTITDGKYYGLLHNTPYLIQDDAAPYFYEVWQQAITPAAVANKVLSNKELWGSDLHELNGFRESVITGMEAIEVLPQ